MTKHTERARIRKLVRAEFKRTGDKRLLSRIPPKKIKRGKFPAPPKTSKAVSVKPRSILHVVRGTVTRKKVEKATQTKKSK